MTREICWPEVEGVPVGGLSSPARAEVMAMLRMRESDHCAHGRERVAVCIECHMSTREIEYAAHERTLDAQTSDLARICAEAWAVPVRVIGELHVRTSIHGTGPALSVRWESRYLDGHTPDGRDVHRRAVWVPAIDGHDLPWQLSPKVAAHMALEGSRGR